LDRGSLRGACSSSAMPFLHRPHSSGRRLAILHRPPRVAHVKPGSDWGTPRLPQHHIFSGDGLAAVLHWSGSFIQSGRDDRMPTSA
jgi:hypothetical protein